MQVVDDWSADLLALIESDWSGETIGKTLNEILPSWLTYKSRSISHVRRKVIWSNRVKTVRSLHPAIEKIAIRLKKGASLKPYLHKQIYTDQQSEAADLLYLDWRIHHFHLGLENDLASVGRTSDLLFAYIEHETVFLLDVRPHGVWTDEDLIRALIEAAPHVAERHELKDIMALAYETNSAERMSLRKSGVNTAVAVDGKFYAIFGGGISSAMTSIKSLRTTDQLFREIAEIREQIAGGAIQVPEWLGRHLLNRLLCCAQIFELAELLYTRKAHEKFL
jgi:hypothetical protein